MTNLYRLRRRQRGVSLIEALVAFGVMAFGMLGVVGMQATLRSSGDLARQRAEAVRIAQDYVEEWRGFSTLVATPGRMAYADIASIGNTTIAGSADSNATYTLKRRAPVAPAVPGTMPLPSRTVVVDVEWPDRTGQLQSVRLSTLIAGIEPELAASIVLPSNVNPVVSPRGRFRGIPADARSLGVGISGYVPPGQPAAAQAVAWVFNNTSGVITLCTTTGRTSADLQVASMAPVCGSNRALLLSGGVRFATAGDPAVTGVADPAGPLYPAFAMHVVQTAPAVRSVACYQSALSSTQVDFYCAVPITAETPNWTGRIVFDDPPLAIATTIADPTATAFKVCRYSAAATYAGVNQALLSQNFVLIRAGNGSDAYQCPTTTTPRTWAHQPVT